MISIPVILVAAQLAATHAPGQVTPGTECGAAGTGYIQGPTGRPVLVTRTAEQAAGFRVHPNGEWTQCEAKAAPVPVPCPGSNQPREWVVDGLKCTSYVRNNQSATDPSRDLGIADGSAAIWRQWTGDNRGHLIERCVAGQRVEIGRTCEVATHCDAPWSWQGYSYNAAARPVAIGGRVEAKSATGKAIKLQCVKGARFVVVR